MSNNIKDKLNNHYYGVKTISVKVEDIDEGSRKVKGYFASFNTLDSDLDIIKEGAFTKSINESGVGSSGNRKIAHLRNHDWDHQIGKLEELFEDSKGLGFISTLGRSTKGNDALLDYQDGIIREHSIGFNYIEDKIKFVEDSSLSKEGHFEVSEVKLWEGSAVTFGANSLTPVIDVAKTEQEYNIIYEKLTHLSASFLDAIKNGKGSDERLQNLEVKFNQIQQLHNSLKEMKPSVKDTLIEEPKPSILLDTLINNNIKK